MLDPFLAFLLKVGFALLAWLIVSQILAMIFQGFFFKGESQDNELTLNLWRAIFIFLPCLPLALLIYILWKAARRMENQQRYYC